MEYSVELAGSKGTLSLRGAVTVEDALRLHEALLQPLEGAMEIEVDLSGVGGVDVTCLQLLCAAHHAETVKGRRFTMAGISPDASGTIEQLGFLRHVGCRNDTGGSCLWLLGKGLAAGGAGKTGM